MKKFFLLFLLAAMVLPMTMNAQNQNDVPEGYARVTLTAGDVWEDGSGYQMLLDADATAYGSTIPETGPLTTNCSGNETIYAEFEYKIPENADGSCSTSNIIINNSITILIPAGVYDWCITNPTPGDRIWIASENGNVGGRANDYEFRSGFTYEFTATLGGSNDQIDVTIFDPNAPVIPTDVQVTPTITTGEVVWVAGENNATWNLRWRPWIDPASVGYFWDLPLDGYEEQLEGWSIYDADGDGNNWGLDYSSDDQDDVCFYSASYANYESLDPDNWLITPEVGLGGTLKFKTWNRTSNYPDKIMVYVCNNPDFSSVDDFVAISEFIQPTEEAEEIELDLSAYEGTGYIAFRHYDSYDQWAIYLDDIEVIPANPAVIPDWIVVEGLTDPNYTIEDLTSNTSYEVQVIAFNELDVNTDWTATVIFTTLEGFIKHIDPYTTKGGYYLIASPIGQVNPSNVGSMLDNEYDLYYFDQAQNKEWINYKGDDNYNQANFDLVPGKGYLYANSGNNGEGIDLAFIGSAYNESGEVTLALETGVVFEGMNLVGNPFAVEAYIDRDFYRLAEGGAEVMAEASHGAIEPMEGVFVYAENDGETMTFTTTAPESTNDKGLALNVSQDRGKVIDRAVVRFGEGRQLPKFQLRENSTKVYIPQNGKDYAVVNVGRDAMHCVSTEIPVNFKAETNGTYTLTMSSPLNSHLSILNLIDNLTGANVNLLETPSYSFEAKTTDYESRFKLVFAMGNKGSDDFAFISNNEIIVNGEGTFQIFDVLGHEIFCKNLSSLTSHLPLLTSPGVYVLRLINGNEVKTQKIVVE